MNEHAKGWMDWAITTHQTDQAVTSWWMGHRSRAEFDQAVQAEQLRMSRSKFGRPTVTMLEKGYGDGE